MATITPTKITSFGTSDGTKVIFSLSIPASGWLAAGNPIDLTDYFSEIYDAIPGASEAVSAYKFSCVIPANGTDIAAATVNLFAHYSTDAAGPMTVVPDSTDLSGVTALRLTVFGKIADPSTT